MIAILGGIGIRGEPPIHSHATGFPFTESQYGNIFVTICTTWYCLQVLRIHFPHGCLVDTWQTCPVSPGPPQLDDDSRATEYMSYNIVIIAIVIKADAVIHRLSKDNRYQIYVRGSPS